MPVVANRCKSVLIDAKSFTVASRRFPLLQSLIVDSIANSSANPIVDSIVDSIVNSIANSIVNSKSPPPILLISL